MAQKITPAHINLLLKHLYVPDQLTDEETTQAKNISLHKASIGEVVETVMEMTKPTQQQINGVDRGIDVVEVLLRTKLNLTDKDFETAEKSVDEMNKKAQEEMLAGMKEKLEALRKESGNVKETVELKGDK